MSGNTGPGESKPPTLEEIVEGFKTLRREFGEQAEQISRNIAINQLLASVLIGQPEGIDKRRKMMEKMEDAELIRASQAAEKLASEITAYRMWKKVRANKAEKGN